MISCIAKQSGILSPSRDVIGSVVCPNVVRSSLTVSVWLHMMLLSSHGVGIDSAMQLLPNLFLLPFVRKSLPFVYELVSSYN